MTNGLQATILIPTYNRDSVLPLCLEAIAALNTDPQLFEVIIIDNNSTDRTREFVSAFADVHPNLSIRLVVETRQGVSNARNRGLAEARGEFIYFLDDDSPPTREWFNLLQASFHDPSVGCAGGPSNLDFQGQIVPPWLQGDLQGLISGYGLSFTKPTPVSKWEQFPLSCNMAIRKAALANLAPFRNDLGRIGETKLTGGETELIDRIHRAGWTILYVPDAEVLHIVPPERLAKSYLYKIGYGHAVSHIIRTADSRLSTSLSWFVSDAWYVTRRLLWLIFALLRGKPNWFDDYMCFWMAAIRLPLRAKAVWKGRILPQGVDQVTVKIRAMKEL